MSSLRIIKRRIRSVQSTEQITKAMEMVAAAKLMRSRRDLEAARPYSAAMASMLSHLTEEAAGLDHPLFENREKGPEVLVVFSSDRGLCGAFNTTITRQVRAFAAAPDRGAVKLVFVGRKVWDHFRRRDWDILDLYGPIGTGVDLELARRITGDLIALFLKGEVRAIHLLYTRFVSMLRRDVVVEKLLNVEPPQAPAGDKAGGGAKTHGPALDYIFEPSAREVFAELLPRYTLSRVVSAFLESFASEHSARMVAMGSATKNAEEVIDRLVLQRNRMRQAIITKEIAELVGGAEALA